MSHNQKKDAENIHPDQAEQNENSNNGEKLPEFNVSGTALNDLHSPFEF